MAIVGSDVPTDLSIQGSQRIFSAVPKAYFPHQCFFQLPETSRETTQSIASTLNITAHNVHQYGRHSFSAGASFPRLKSHFGSLYQLKDYTNRSFDKWRKTNATSASVYIFTADCAHASDFTALAQDLRWVALSVEPDLRVTNAVTDLENECIQWTLTCTGRKKAINGADLSEINTALWTNPHVRWVEIAPPIRPLNNIATRTLQRTDLTVGVMHPLWANGITGRGQVIAIGDTGLNYESCFFRDETSKVAFYPQVNPSHRKIVSYVQCIYHGRPRVRDLSHGTHVCCSALGQAEGREASAFNGVAYGAKLYFHALSCSADGMLNLPFDMQDYFRPQLKAGAFISSNSWGSQLSPTYYPYNDRQTDRFLYENPQFLVIFAAGNDPAEGILSPGSSKNALTVSAHCNSFVQMNREKLSAHAAHGPTYDGRIKPDILGPGEYVTSAASREHQMEAVCDLGVKAGTSMAAPLVAGSAALIRQYFTDGFYPSGKASRRKGFQPTGALLKAMVLHSVHYPQNRTSALDRPNITGGWGRLEEMRHLLYFRQRNATNHLYVINSHTIGHHERLDVCFVARSVGRSSMPPFLRATLVWMDPPLPAVGAQSSMAHDLDLVVSFPDGRMVYANSRDSFDMANNVEQVTLPLADTADDFSFKVSVYGSFVKYSPQCTTQRYALVVSAPGLQKRKRCRGFQCPRNCTARGRCSLDGNCECRQPFYHIDCSLQ